MTEFEKRKQEIQTYINFLVCTEEDNNILKDALKDVRFRTGLLLGCAIFFANGAFKLAHAEIPIKQISFDIYR